MEDDRQPRTRRRGARAGPTIADVAREAGVSTMTVSRVVNADARVQEDTRARVAQVIEALGYVPHQAARSLASGRQLRIALLHSNPSQGYLSEFLIGALAEASACDAQLVVEHCSEDHDHAELARRLGMHRIDACLLPPPLCEDAELLTALRASGIPFAQVATGDPAADACAVSIDDEAAAHAMTSRLIAQGHRRIGFVKGNANQTASALRSAGYRRALAEAGIGLDPALAVNGDFSYRSGLLAADALLALKPRPTAIFASNDDMAAACIAACHRKGLDVPGEISICGFDDTSLATAVWPELTTIRQPIAAMARRAVQLLANFADGASAAPCHDRFDFELVSRSSDGPAGAR